jgi:hypothetical protein
MTFNIECTFHQKLISRVHQCKKMKVLIHANQGIRICKIDQLSHHCHANANFYSDWRRRGKAADLFLNWMSSSKSAKAG